MKRKSEKSKDKEKSYPDKKSEKATRRSRRHSRRRKKSASTSPERDESGTEDNETSLRSSQDDTEEEQHQQSSTVPEESVLQIGAIITAEDGDHASDMEDRLVASRTRRSSKKQEESTSDEKVTAAKAESAQEDEWKEDERFWKEGDAQTESSEQKRKEKEAKSEIWKVKNPNGSGGQLKLCIIRPQEPAEPSPRRRKRLSRTPSNQQPPQKDKKETGEDAEPERKVSRDSSEEKLSSPDDRRKSRRTFRERRDSSEEKVKQHSLSKERLKTCDGLDENHIQLNVSSEGCDVEVPKVQIETRDSSEERLKQEENKDVSSSDEKQQTKSVVVESIASTLNETPTIKDFPVPEASEEKVITRPPEKTKTVNSPEGRVIAQDSPEERVTAEGSPEERVTAVNTTKTETVENPSPQEQSELARETPEQDYPGRKPIARESSEERPMDSSKEMSKDEELSKEGRVATGGRGESSEEVPVTHGSIELVKTSEEDLPGQKNLLCVGHISPAENRTSENSPEGEETCDSSEGRVEVTVNENLESEASSDTRSDARGSPESRSCKVFEDRRNSCDASEEQLKPQDLHEDVPKSRDQSGNVSIGHVIKETSPVDDSVEKNVNDENSLRDRGSSEEQAPEAVHLRERQKSLGALKDNLDTNGISKDNSKEMSVHRKSGDSSSSGDGKETCRQSRSKESYSRSYHSDTRISRREGRDTRRHSRARESRSPEHHKSRRRSTEGQSASKHRRRYSTSKSRSPQQRREKIALRRSFSRRSDKAVTKDTEEEEKLQSNKPDVPSQKEDKENHDKKINEEVVVDATPEPIASVPRKRRWGQRNSSRPSTKPVLSISTDSLKNLIPGAKPIPIGEVQLTQEEEPKKEIESKENDEEKERRDTDKIRERENQEHIGEKKTVVMLPDAPRLSVAVTDDQRGKAVTRKISIVSDDARTLQRSPSPPRHKATSVLFITNLVRPFTVNQLRELLARTGTIVESGFWIDKIKSKCYVEYERESEARETRHALHGVRWPVSNPKQLCVDFGKKEDMELAQVLSETDQIPRKTEPLKVDRSVEGWVAEQTREKEHERELREREKERERERERMRSKERPHAIPIEALEHNRSVKMAASVREWDLGKIGQLSPNERERDLRYEAEKNRERERKMRKEKSHRSRSPTPHEVSARKTKKKEEDAPAKLLDDLFRKTKTTPCIYWLPLTAEQIVVKEEMRRKHMAEHERRMAEMRKAERERERVRAQQRQQRRGGEREKRRRRSGSGSPKK